MGAVLARAREQAASGQLTPAITAIERELAVAKTLPSRAQWLMLLAKCQAGQLESEKANKSARAAEDLFELQGRSEEALYCRLMQLRLQIDGRELRLARHVVEDGVSLAVKHGWKRAEALALEFQGLVHLHSKEYANGAVELRQVLEREDDYKLPWEWATVRLTLASCLFGLGETAEAQRIQEQLQTQDDLLRVPRLAAILQMNAALAAWLKRNFAQARDHFWRVLELANKELADGVGKNWLQALARYNLGLVELQQGQLGLAKKHLLRAWHVAQSANFHQLACASLTSLSGVALLENKPGDAVQYALNSSQNVKDFEDIEAQLVHYYLALAYLGAGRLDEALEAWKNKQSIEINAETAQVLEWMLLILDHMSSKRFSVDRPLDEASFRALQAWRKEIKGWRV